MVIFRRKFLPLFGWWTNQQYISAHFSPFSPDSSAPEWETHKKISFVTDRRNCRFSLRCSHLPLEELEDREQKLWKNGKALFLEFDELRWCVLIHFDVEWWADLSWRSPAYDMQRAAVSQTSSRTPAVRKWIKNTLINHSSVQFVQFSSIWDFSPLSFINNDISGERKKEERNARNGKFIFNFSHARNFLCKWELRGREIVRVLMWFPLRCHMMCHNKGNKRLWTERYKAVHT